MKEEERVARTRGGIQRDNPARPWQIAREIFAARQETQASIGLRVSRTKNCYENDIVRILASGNKSIHGYTRVPLFAFVCVFLFDLRREPLASRRPARYSQTRKESQLTVLFPLKVSH